MKNIESNKITMVHWELGRYSIVYNRSDKTKNNFFSTYLVILNN